MFRQLAMRLFRVESTSSTAAVDARLAAAEAAAMEVAEAVPAILEAAVEAVAEEVATAATSETTAVDAVHRDVFASASLLTVGSTQNTFSGIQRA